MSSKTLKKCVPKESIWQQIARDWLASADSTGYIGREWRVDTQLTNKIERFIYWRYGMKEFLYFLLEKCFNASYSKQQASDNDKIEEKCSMTFLDWLNVSYSLDSNKFEFTRTYYIFIGNDRSHLTIINTTVSRS